MAASDAGRTQVVQASTPMTRRKERFNICADFTTVQAQPGARHPVLVARLLAMLRFDPDCVRKSLDGPNVVVRVYIAPRFPSSLPREYLCSLKQLSRLAPYATFNPLALVRTQ